MWLSLYHGYLYPPPHHLRKESVNDERRKLLNCGHCKRRWRERGNDKKKMTVRSNKKRTKENCKRENEFEFEPIRVLEHVYTVNSTILVHADDYMPRPLLLDVLSLRHVVCVMRRRGGVSRWRWHRDVSRKMLIGDWQWVTHPIPSSHVGAPCIALVV